MNPVLFQKHGILLDQEYLPGQYRWGVPIRLRRVLLDCQPPSAGVFTLALEVGGVLSTVEISVPAGATRVTREFEISTLIPADTYLRWRAGFDNLAENAPTNVSLTLYAVPQSVSEVTTTRPALTVQWVNGRERLTVFNYDADTHTFTETLPGISVGRASLIAGSQFSLAIRAIEVMRVADDRIYVPEFVALGGVASLRSPRLTFAIDDVPIAALADDALRVAELTEADPDILTSADAEFYRRFEFYSNGTLTAVLNAAGLTAKGLVEPIP